MKLEVVNSTTKCRPLITTSYPSEEASYLQLPYQYDIKNIRLLQTYLCPGVKVVGVDFIQKPQPMPKLKYKTVSIDGVNVESKQKIRFNGKDNYCKFQWIVDVAVQLPMNSQQLKTQIFKNITIFSIENGCEVPVNGIQISQKQMMGSKIFCMTSFKKKQSLGKEKRRILMNKIPISIMLPNLISYRRQKIIEILADDLAKSINISTQNQLFHRVVARHQNLIPIQNYYKNVDDTDQQFLKLIDKSNTRKQPLITSEPLSPTILSKNTIKDNKNVIQYIVLIVVLLMVVGGYVFIKFT